MPDQVTAILRPARSSLNFGFLDTHTAHFDRLGADAETFLHTDPDLTLLRARQLLELFALVLERRGDPRVVPDNLDDRLRLLRYAWNIPEPVWKGIDAVRRFANDAVHVERTGPKQPSVFANSARKALPLLHRGLVWLSGQLEGQVPDVVYKPPTSSSKGEPVVFDGLMHRLDDIEELVDVHYALEQAATALAGLDTELEREVRQRRVGQNQLSLLRLRSRSIERARLNHLGETVRPADTATVEELGRPLIASGLPEAIEEVTEFRNRIAVGYLNALDFERAIDTLEPIVSWQRGQAAQFGEAFGDAPVVNALLGRVLGTRGQALAFRGHAYLDRRSLQDALACFDEAGTLFVEAADKARQATYAAQTLVERAKHFGDVELSEADQQRLAASAVCWVQDAAVFAADPLLRSHPRAHAFGVALGLKHAYVTGTRPDWFMAVCEALSAASSPTAPFPGHPYEQLIGYLMLLHPGGVPSVLARAARGAEEPDTLPGHVARTFALERSRRASQLDAGELDRYRDHLPSALSGWWSEYEIDKRLRGLLNGSTASALHLLPFNYC